MELIQHFERKNYRLTRDEILEHLRKKPELALSTAEKIVNATNPVSTPPMKGDLSVWVGNIRCLEEVIVRDLLQVTEGQKMEYTRLNGSGYAFVHVETPVVKS